MDTSELRNGKYFLGEYTNHGNFKGWFVGSFFDRDHPCKTDNIEVLYIEHKVGDTRQLHYHKQKVELIIMIEGKARYNVNGKEVIVEAGNFLFIDVNNVISVEFLQPSKIFVVHSPSIPTDKVNIDTKHETKTR